jgi:hypothetical protein
MTGRNGRLSLAFEVQSVARLNGNRPTTSEAPAATGWVAVPVCEAGTRGLTTPHHCEANEGADVAKSTRGVPRSDSETRDSAVKITPASTVSATVPTTHAVA